MRQHIIHRGMESWRVFCSCFGTVAALLMAVVALHAAPGAAWGQATAYIQNTPASNGIFRYPWRTANAELRQLIAQLGRIDGKYPIYNDTTIAVTSLPFFDHVALLYIRDSRWKPESLSVYFLIDKKGALYRLSGSSEPIHTVNAAVPPILTEHTVRDYIWFFGFFVRGEEGPFLVVESTGDTFFPKNPDLVKTLQKHIRPIHLTQVNTDGSFSLDAVVYYSNALFRANFKVHKTGVIEMSEDTPLAANLPARINAPLQ